MTLAELCNALRESRGFAHKRDISDVVSTLARHLPGGEGELVNTVANGDDCAAIPDGHGGHLLLAIEGLVEDFIEAMPRFAGYCGVMVNVSDIAAMGGRPMAVVDALWSRGMAPGGELLAGMAEAAQKYGVPIVGGHSNNRSERGQLAVAILGRASHLLTSFDARPGDQLVMAVDLRGAYEEPYPFWNASTTAPGERLRGDLELLPQLAESGLCRAGKDISMAGAIGTALMLLEASQVGAEIDLDALPRPASVQTDAHLLRWLSAFPSFGFVLSVGRASTGEVVSRFHARGLACAVIGEVHASPQLSLRRGGERRLLWDVAEQAFIRPEIRPKIRPRA